MAWVEGRSLSRASLEAALVVAPVIAPALQLPESHVVDLLATIGMMGAMEGSGFDEIGCCGPAAISAETAMEVVSLLDHDSCEVREMAACAIRCLPRDEKNRGTLTDAGAIPATVRLLERGPGAAAAGAIVGLALSPGSVQPLLRAGIVERLLALLRYGSDLAKLTASIALGNVAYHGEFAKQGFMTPDVANALVDLLDSSSDAVREEATQGLLSLSAGNSQTVRTILPHAIPPLVTLITDAARPPWKPRLEVHAQSPPRVRSAICTLLAVAASDARGVQRHPAAEIGRLPLEMLCLIFETMTQTHVEGMRAVATLRNLCLSSSDTCDLLTTVVEAGAIGPIVTLLVRGSDPTREKAAGALLTLSSNPAAAVRVVAAGAIPPMALLLGHKEAGMRERAVGAMQAMLANAGEGSEMKAVEAGALPPLVRMARSGGAYAQLRAVQCIAAIARNPALHSALLAVGAIDVAEELEAHALREIQWQAGEAIRLLGRRAAQDPTPAAPDPIVVEGVHVD